MVISLFALVTQLLTEPAMATGVSEISNLEAGNPTWIIDKAEVLSKLNEGAINKKLGDLAQNTGNEVRVVTIHRLDYGETAESFANELFKKWFPTPEAQTNQTLLFLDTKTNTTAIRTGSQVKSVLPDKIAQSIASETMLVPIRKGNYNQAVLDASDRLSAVLSGLPDPGPPEVKTVTPESTFKTKEETNAKSATLIVVGLLLAATIIPMVTYFIYQGQS
jgi:uncharacterized protein